MTEIKIESFALGPIGTNAYLLTNPDTNRSVVIDPGLKPQALLRRLEGRALEAILLTHAHWDHIGGVEELRNKFACPVYVHDLEAGWLTDARKNGSARWPDLSGPILCEPAEHALDEGMQLRVIGTELRVFHTPGHSPGSVSFLMDKHLFAGDVLFRLSVGRVDLPGGDERDLLDSIHMKLFELDDDVSVYPGHGPKTTIGYERAHNPYV